MNIRNLLSILDFLHKSKKLSGFLGETKPSTAAYIDVREERRQVSTTKSPARLIYAGSLLLLSMSCNAFAQQQISNLIIPVNYFVNHEQQLKILDNHLNKYRQASIVGTSGIGKTQLIRMYVYENKNNYDLIWFFDCNLGSVDI